MNPAGRIIRLPCYGITLTLARENGVEEPGSGSIVSDLRDPRTAANQHYNAAIDGLESLIVAHACAGVDVESPAYVEGIETAVDAIATPTDQLGDDAAPIHGAADLESMVRELFTHVDRAGQPHQRQTRPGGTAEYSVLVPIPAELLRRVRAALESNAQRMADTVDRSNAMSDRQTHGMLKYDHPEKSTMKRPHDLDRAELERIADAVQRCLYFDTNTGQFDPDHDWSGADVCESLAFVLSNLGMVPDDNQQES